MPTAVSLFSGCGGSDLGLRQAGFDVLWANDKLQYAGQVHRANFSETDFHAGDIAKVATFPKSDLLVGCYPCQGFSQAGSRRADNGINFLYRQFDRVLRLIQPKAFIVENVSGMRRSDLKHLLQNQITRFRLAGYRVSFEVLNAMNYGVPQFRERIFIVGIRSDFGVRYRFPAPTHGDGLRPIINLKQAIGHLPDWPEGEYFEDEFHWYYLSRNRYRGWNEVSRTIVAKARHLPLHPVSPRLRRLHTDAWEFESYAPARRLSYREAAIIQGFPESFKFPDSSLPAKYTVIGNAVPPPLFAAIAKGLPNIW